jgi:hypothetical protein
VEAEKTGAAVESASAAEPGEGPKLVEPARITEHEESPATAEAVAAPAKPSLPPMKGLERVKSAQPAEPFEGWKPVENWPPAEAAAEPQEKPEVPRPRGRWVRMKY